MLCPVHLAHLLLLADDHMRARHIHLALRHVLRPLEAVQQVCPDRTVEVESEPRDDCWKDGARSRGRFRERLDVGGEFVQERLDCWGAWEGYELCVVCDEKGLF